jgi:hypothetical protein
MRDTHLQAIDFIRTFPYRFWYSAWFADEDHPAGCRYKILSTRTAPSGPFEVVVLVQLADGSTSEADRSQLSEAAFEKTAQLYVDGLSQNGKLVMFAVDLIRCRDRDAMQRILDEAGWFRGPGG